MANSETNRYHNTFEDLLKFDAGTYCDLGPGRGEIAIKLKEAGKSVIALEAPWEFEERTAWAKENGINVYPGEFFETNFEAAIPEKVSCFSLIHAIAHFRFAPHVLLEKVYNKLEPGGYFYLSTVNGGSLDRVLRLFRGGTVTEEVKKETNNEFYEDYCKYYNPTGRYMIWDDWMHVKEYTAPELKKIFEAEKFEVVDLRFRNNFIHWKSKLACRFKPHLAEEIIIVGRKPE